MKTKNLFWRSLALIICVWATSDAFAASSVLTFKDTWRDSLAYDQPDALYVVNTTGTFSSTVSLPLDGIDLSEADENTAFSFYVGPSGATVPIVDDTLGDAEGFTAGKTSALYPIVDQNSGNTVGKLTVSWTKTTISVSCSISEDFLGEESTFQGDSQGFLNTVTLNTASTEQFYEVSIMLDAWDNGGGTYNYDNTTVPVTGSDTESDPNPDGNGPYPLESGSVTGTGDFTPPKIAISSSTQPANSKISDQNTVIDLKGTASDVSGITDVEIAVNGNFDNEQPIDQAGSLPTNSVNWTAELDLSQLGGQPGPNEIVVLATDGAGNLGSTTREFIWIENNKLSLSVNPNGAGTVKGLANGEALQVGYGYPVSATPASKNWIFSEWTDAAGDVLSSNASFTYFDEDETITNAPAPSLVAKFGPNPFTNADLVGAYTGIFYDNTNGVSPSDAGYLLVNVTSAGAFSGKIYDAVSSASLAFSGELAVATGATNAVGAATVKVNKSLSLSINFQIAIDPVLTDPGAGTLSGSVVAFATQPGSEVFEVFDAAALQGQLSRYNAGTSPGLYNLAVSPATNDPSQGPGGWSYGSATVSSKTGGVALTLNLADGVSPALSFSTFLGNNGSCPLYASLYGGSGVILGWLQFATDGSGTLQAQTLNWIKIPVADKYYVAGFTATPTVTGASYLAPKKGSLPAGLSTTDTLGIDTNYAGLTLPDEIDLATTYNPAKNTFSFASAADKPSLTLTTANGLLKGSFTSAEAGTSAPITFHGVIFGSAGYGFWIDSALKETGPISLTSSAAAAAKPFLAEPGR